MYYTLGQAAKATGKTKPTIAHSIRKGRVSATKSETGEYQIDPAELHRVYPPLPEKSSPQSDDVKPPFDTEMRVENATLKARVDALEAVNRQLEGERDNLREQNTRITALLTTTRTNGGWLLRLFGRSA